IPDLVHPAGLSERASSWFGRRFGRPTEIQRRAWPLVASGQHVLISAATGTGKTLAAFLPLLDRVLADGSPEDLLVGLYVAPLRPRLHETGRPFPRPRGALAAESPPPAAPAVVVRTGDTPAAGRRALLRQPPAVLLTTPESLAILLSQETLQGLFATLRWV